MPNVDDVGYHPSFDLNETLNINIINIYVYINLLLNLYLISFI